MFQKLPIVAQIRINEYQDNCLDSVETIFKKSEFISFITALITPSPLKAYNNER